MAKKKQTNWIKLYRSLAEHEIWFMEPFSRGQAWVDLLLMVCYEETDNTHRGNLVHLPKGSIRVSVDYLSKRWQRSTKWTRHTLEILKGKQMVYIKGTTQGTIITIANYEVYQGQGQTKGQTKDTAKGTHNKNIKKLKEINKEKADEFADKSGDIGNSPPEQPEERYITVRSQDGREFIYDTKEDRYVN